MSPTETVEARQLSAAIGTEAGRELAEALSRIEHCLRQLSDEQVWWRISESQNSIGNLILHLSGNIRQWLICGVGRKPDIRNRPAEFSERRKIPKSALLEILRSAVADATSAMTDIPPAEMLAPRRIQGFDETALGAIFSSVSHFRGHTQEEGKGEAH